MPIATGTRVGPYEIQRLIGAGGMGEVYHAHDPRLGREVAIKVLSQAISQNSERLRRFEQEARAAAKLNHPNILAIYDIGEQDGIPYLVSELLAGGSLREQLNHGPIPVRKAIRYAVEIACGLAAAHEKGIVHRDLKPENVFITSDGRAKILDFGLAKLIEPLAEREPTSQSTIFVTQPGIVLGTPAYMSPEQVRGDRSDSRGDIFSLGIILHEMITGKSPFVRDSAIGTMNAIISDDAPEEIRNVPDCPPGLQRIVQHCLEKDPQQRFQSVKDIMLCLEDLGELSVSAGGLQLSKPRTSLRFLLVWCAPLVIAAAVAGLFVGKRLGSPRIPSYHRLTFRRASISEARFAPDGRTVVYSATLGANKDEIFTTTVDSPESRSLSLSGFVVVAVSRSGELAIQAAPRTTDASSLFRVPESGGAPRPVLENAVWADWSPDGKSLAVATAVQGHQRIEYPPGKVLFDTAGWISNLRFSPQGDRLAFMTHLANNSFAGTIDVVDLSGKHKVLSSGWVSEYGVAWSPKGDEIWFTASTYGHAYALYAVTLSGKQRLITRAPGTLTLHDIAPDGRVLLTRDVYSFGVIGRPDSKSKERDLSWMDNSMLADISKDGKLVLFGESGEGGGENHSVYLRSMDGSSQPIRLGDGDPLALSPDGKWAASTPPETRNRLVLLPTGAGEPFTLNLAPVEAQGWPIWWTEDGKRIYFNGSEPGHSTRVYAVDLFGGPPRPSLPDGLLGMAMSPNRKSIVVSDQNGRFMLYAIDGGSPAPIKGALPGDLPLIVSGDSRFLYVQNPTSPDRVYRLGLRSGERQLWVTLLPPDTASISTGVTILTPNGTSYAYSYERILSDLYVVDGLK